MIDWPRTMPALVTPFTPAGDLDREGHASNVGIVSERGARGVLVGGSTGQGPYLEAGERTLLARGARDAAPGIVVLCGVFAESVRQALGQIEEAAIGGADAALVATPGTLVRSRPDRIDTYFRDVADRADIPILLYTVPQVTGIELSASSVADLAGEAGVVGVKDSGGDATRFSAWSALVVDGFAAYVGASRALADAHANGAYGAITASANYALTDVSLAVRGDAEAQRRLTALTSTVEAHGVAGTMLAASLTGLEVGVPRAPLAAPPPSAADSIEEHLTAAGLRSSQQREQR